MERSGGGLTIEFASNELYQTIEASLQLAAHAETWEWKEAIAAPTV